ncbi:MAG: hypothetical protein Q8Q08_00410, partial [Candidatus Omnitrophota bacterium]|nr:hypothetical protein [Candidatus Omnitrophota bacterium]
MVSKSMVSVDKTTGEIIEQPGGTISPLLVTPQAIQQTQQSIALLRGLVKDTLVRGRDFGSVPGVQGEFLWDPGASIIISSYSCRPGERRMIHFVDNKEEISAVIEVPLVSFATGTVVATGLGAASTSETKYKYRWVYNPAEWGYTEDAIKTLKTKEWNDKTQYRIPNPEHGDLVNTIVKMASKRAESDAAQSLPGVASALRELFEPRKKQETNKPDWSNFWAQTKKMGMPEAEVHEMLGVKSVGEWLHSGKTLDDAINVLSEKLAGKGTVKPPTPAKRDPASLKSLADLYKACKEDFKLQPADVVKELGYSSQADISMTPAEAYI